MEERRQGDILILEKLANIQTNLALNTQETKRIADAQVATNGKVAAHEVRQQSLEANQAVVATALSELTTDKKNRISTRNVILSRAGWAIAGGCLVLGGRILTYLIQSDFLKQIIK